MISNNLRIRLAIIFLFVFGLTSLAQTVNVIDSKGTIRSIDPSITNEIQDLNLDVATSILTITLNGSATAIDLTPYLDNQTVDVFELNADGRRLTISLEDDGLANLQVDLSQLLINGDVTGTLAGSTVTKIQGQEVSGTIPATGQTLVYNGGTNQYEPMFLSGTASASVSERYPNENQTVTESAIFSTINFQSQDFAPNATDYINESDGITVLNNGRYKITYRVTSEVFTNSRSGGEFRLTRNGTAVNNTSSYTYQRNNQVDKNTVTMVKILDLVVNDKIGVEGRVYESSRGGTDSLTIVPEGTMLTIERF